MENGKFDLVAVQGQRVKRVYRERVPHTPFSGRRLNRTHRTLLQGRVNIAAIYVNPCHFKIHTTLVLT